MLTFATLAFTLFALNAQASRLLDCATLGGKSIKIQYGIRGIETVLEDLQIDGQSSMAGAEFRFSRSGMNLTLSNGSMFIERAGKVSQTNSSGSLVEINCKISNTAEKQLPKEF